MYSGGWDKYRKGRDTQSLKKKVFSALVTVMVSVLWLWCYESWWQWWQVSCDCDAMCHRYTDANFMIMMMIIIITKTTLIYSALSLPIMLWTAILSHLYILLSCHYLWIKFHIYRRLAFSWKALQTQVSRLKKRKSKEKIQVVMVTTPTTQRWWKDETGKDNNSRRVRLTLKQNDI